MAKTFLSRSSRPCAVLVAAILLNLSHADAGNTFTALTPNLADVRSAINVAVDGDTVIVPAGTASWTSTLAITKAITLIGQTTITDTATNTFSDQSIILDNVPRQPGTLLSVNVASGKTVRVSGLTFKAGTVTTTANNGSISLGGTSTAIRFDHCHLVNLYSNYNIWWLTARGVVDHCIIDTHSQPMSVWADGYGGGTLGDKSWAESAHWGSDKFVFFEDNRVNNTSSTWTAIDCLRGGRMVIRHNHLYNTVVSTHGTETLRDRGSRAVEFYKNDCHVSVGMDAGGTRSGGLMAHDNTYDGKTLGHGFSIQTFRTFAGVGPWNGAHGANPWDVNDTEGNGTCVAGHPPHVYGTGKVTASSISGATQTIIATTNVNWTANQLAHYGLKNLTNSAGGASALITSNTATSGGSTTFTCYYYTDSGGGTKFRVGDNFEIHRVLTAQDQQGRGAGDLLTGTTPINSTTGTAAWPHQQLEPSYSWSNFSNGVQQNFGGNTLPAIANRDFYNQAAAVGGVQTTGVGVGTLANRPATGVAGKDITGVTANPPGTGYWATDTQTLYVWIGGAWVAYYTPYTYPHPLVTNSTVTAIQPPTNLTITP